MVETDRVETASDAEKSAGYPLRTGSCIFYIRNEYVREVDENSHTPVFLQIS